MRFIRFADFPAFCIINRRKRANFQRAQTYTLLLAKRPCLVSSFWKWTLPYAAEFKSRRHPYLKLVIGVESAVKLSNHKLSQPVAWQPDLMRTIYGDRDHYLKLTLRNDASQSRCGFKMNDLNVSCVRSTKVLYGLPIWKKERNDTINANKLNAREVAWTACTMLFSRATDPRKRQRIGKEMPTATSGWLYFSTSRIARLLQFCFCKTNHTCTIFFHFAETVYVLYWKMYFD